MPSKHIYRSSVIYIYFWLCVFACELYILDLWSAHFQSPFGIKARLWHFQTGQLFGYRLTASNYSDTVTNLLSNMYTQIMFLTFPSFHTFTFSKSLRQTICGLIWIVLCLSLQIKPHKASLPVLFRMWSLIWKQKQQKCERCYWIKTSNSKHLWKNRYLFLSVRWA